MGLRCRLAEISSGPLIPIPRAAPGCNTERPASTEGWNLVTQGAFEIGYGKRNADGRHAGELRLTHRTRRTCGSGTGSHPTPKLPKKQFRKLVLDHSLGGRPPGAGDSSRLGRLSGSRPAADCPAGRRDRVGAACGGNAGHGTARGQGWDAEAARRSFAEPVGGLCRSSRNRT